MGKSKHKQMSKSDLRKHDEIDQLLQKVKEGEIETNIRVVEVKEKSVAQPKKSEFYLEYNGVRVNINEVELTDHSYLRAKQRLNLEHHHALGQTRTMLKNAKCLGYHVSKDDHESILYAVGKTAIHMSTCLKFVKTFKKRESVTYLPLKEKVVTLHETELRKIERLEKSKLRKLKTLQLECAAEKSQLELRIHKSRSQAIRNVCHARIHAINQTLEFYQNEIANIQEEKRMIVNSLISVV